MRRIAPIVILGAALVLGTVWYFGLFRPIDTARLRVTRSEVAAREQYQELSARLARLETLESDRANQDALARRLEAAVPAGPDLGGFIVEANTIASNAAISWISITPSPSAVAITTDFTALPLEIRVEGGYGSVIDYVTRLEQAKRLVIIDSMTMAPLPPERGPQDITNPQLGCSMRARIFTRAAAFTSLGVAQATPSTSTATTTTTVKKAGT
ncbi:MAG: type 4a pilus biogenesis protein PilO [Acidimicrobiia bacterium]